MVTEITDEVHTSFGNYYPYAATFTPNIPSFTVEPDISNVDKMTGVSPTDSLLLQKNHFMVRKSEYTQIYEVYNQSTNDGQPLSSIWRSLYKLTIFFVGKTDDPNIYDYKNIADQVYGDNFLNLSVDSLANESLLIAFMDQAQLLPEPGIPNWIYVTFTIRKAFRFMGQRFIPDSYMFSELVIPKDGVRIFPKGLDVMTIWGSDRAFTILVKIHPPSSAQWTVLI